ncbi:MAG: hypothetical protein RJA44_1478, partial [Pseudomonadota bacterium]
MIRRHRARRHSHGFSLIELMVALVLGLLLTGASLGLLLAQLAEQRRQLLELRLTQDLRAAADVALRDLRRAGYRGDAADAVWQDGGGQPPPNPYSLVHPPAGSSTTAAGYAYSQGREDGVVSNDERPGLRHNSSNRSIDLRLSGAAIAPGSGDTWQALTDPAQIRITRVEIRHDEETISLLERCRVNVCPAGAGDC